MDWGLLLLLSLLGRTIFGIGLLHLFQKLLNELSIYAGGGGDLVQEKHDVTYLRGSGAGDSNGFLS